MTHIDECVRTRAGESFAGPRRAFAFALLVTAMACAGATVATPITNASIAPSLGIDITEYTRTPEGLYYKDVRIGDGAEAKPDSRVTVAYRGLLADGTQVDSSAGLTFRLQGDPVIRGWKIGVPGMHVGGARILVIPPELGYEWRQVGAIPPNSTLVFRVQLVAVR